MYIKRVVLVLAVLVLAGIACQFSGEVQAPAIPTVPSALPFENNAETGSTGSPAAEQDVLVSLYERVSPGAVAILTEQGQGSGFVYDAQGHIVTNYHVVEGSKKVEVDFMSGHKTFGTVIATD